MSSYDLPSLAQCDHCVLNLLRSHLMQEEVDGKRLESSQIQELLTQFRGALDHGGVISVTSNGQVKFMTQRTEQLLQHYFSSYSTPRLLPSLLQTWFKHQLSQVLFNGDKPCLCSSLHIEQDKQQLVIRFIPDPVRGHYLLLLEEQKHRLYSSKSLELLGLTKREAEVLFWVTKDKSNAEIAKVLKCCEGTVGKHLEHIYKKLGVQTRTGAVIFALEKLGILLQ